MDIGRYSIALIWEAMMNDSVSLILTICPSGLGHHLVTLMHLKEP